MEGVFQREEIEKVEKRASRLRFDPHDSIISYSMIQTMSPDSDICIMSPEILSDKNQETPDYMRNGVQRNHIAPVELFSHIQPDGILEPSLKVVPSDRKDSSEDTAYKLRERAEYKNRTVGDTGILVSINAGDMDNPLVYGAINFKKDDFYNGGDTITTDAQVGDGNGLALYQSARFGNFSYKFENLEGGDYLVDLHFAEIVFADGPPGMRIFDVFIQEEKVVSGLDIYAKVGSNQPLILSDLKSIVAGEEGLLIRFEGVVGSPIVSGISVKRDYSSGENFQRQVLGNITATSGRKSEVWNKGHPKEVKCENCRKMKREYDLLFKEQIEVKRALESLRQENELKNKECSEAWMSLQELRMELMRKSMHVGSLAFAVEGQVKEKAKWFSSLRDLTEKFRLLKLEHSKLSEEALEYRSCLADLIHVTTTVQRSGNVDGCIDLEREYKVLKHKFVVEATERRELYNKLVELKGNIRVFCRCRPLNMEEIAEGAAMAIDFEFAKDGELSVKAAHGAHKKGFKFDAVFSPEDDQEKVFERTAPLVTSVLDGYNVCIFAYGQTGTGKTFTMEGTEEARGVNYKTLKELFRIIKEREGQYRYEITVSVLEVYNEQIHDLLQTGSQPGVAAKRLEVRQVAEGVHHVPGLVEAHVGNMNEVWNVLQTGSKARAVSSTNANERSSRSHCIHCVMVKGENWMNGECTRSKLWLIDLAGSERVAKIDVQGERLKEAQNINRSLSALGDVVSALATKSPHIPFRNSKLTHLLQDSLGGDSKTLMFVQISPNENDVGETLCSLNFASRVRGIELGPAKRQVDASEIFRYKHTVEKIKQDNKNKDAHIKRLEETINSLDMKNRGKDLINKNLQDRVKELESQLLIERKLARQHVDTKIAENQLQQQQEEAKRQSLGSSPSARPLPEKHYNQVAEHMTAFMELGNVMLPFNEKSYKPTASPRIDNNIFKYSHVLLKDKENKPELADEESLPRKASRVSLCPTSREIPANPAPRRNSLIPVPSARTLLPPPVPMPMNNVSLSPPLPTPVPLISIREGTLQVASSSRQPRSSKITSILRRSLQKKVVIRSPMQQNIRRAGGADKMRVSIGGSGRKARRIPANEVLRPDRALQHKLQQKERGWNHGTTNRNTF